MIAAGCFVLVALTSLPNAFSSFEQLNQVSFLDDMAIFAGSTFIIAYAVIAIGCLMRRAKIAGIGCVIAAGARTLRLLSTIWDAAFYINYISTSDDILAPISSIAIGICVIATYALLAVLLLKKHLNLNFVYIICISCLVFFVVGGIDLFETINSFFVYSMSPQLAAWSILNSIAWIAGGICINLWMAFKVIPSSSVSQTSSNQVPAASTSSTPATIPMSTTAQPVTAEALEQYAELLKDGVITQEDFDKKKAEFLKSK